MKRFFCSIHAALVLALVMTTPLSAAEETRTSEKKPAFFISVGAINGKTPKGKLIEAEFGQISLSSDARTWETVFHGGLVRDHFSHGNNNMIRALTHGNDRFVAVGNPGIGAMYSMDGRKWHHATQPRDRIGGFCVAFGNGQFVIGRADGFQVSKDGKVWTTNRTHAEIKKRHGVGVWGKEGAGHVRQIVFGKGVFVVIGERRVGATKDGKTFLHHEILPAGKRHGRQSLLFGAGRFIWLREGGHKTTTDGVQWKDLMIGSARAEDTKSQTQGVWTGDRFVVSGKKCVYESKDGLKWTRIPATGWPTIRTAGKGLLLGPRGWAGNFSVSQDGGKTWETWKPKTRIGMRQVYFFDGTGVIGTGGG